VHDDDNGVLMTNRLVSGSINANFTRIIAANEDPAVVHAALVLGMEEGSEGLDIISSNLIVHEKE
jgi:hypothetical protein